MLLLKKLSENARIKFTDLSSTLNLTAEAIAKRYKKIIQSNLIVGLKPRLDFEKLNLSYYHLFISLQDQTKRSAIISYYVIDKDCNTIMQHVGFYDMHLEFITRDIHSVIDNFIEKFGESVASYELLKIQKEHVLNILK